MSPLKKNVAAISAAVAGFCVLTGQVDAGTFKNITFDGNTADWTNIPIAATAAPNSSLSPDLVKLQMANNSSYIYFLLTFATPSNPLGTTLTIDSDNSVSTGYNIYGLSLVGSNASYQNDFPYTQSNQPSGFNTGGSFTNQVLSSAPGYNFDTANPTITQTQELAIPINAAQSDSSTGGYTGPLFQTSTNSFTVLFYNGNSVLGPYTYSIAGPPVQSTYTSTGSGDFNVASNWGNGVPLGADAEADFLSAITANHTVYSDTSITLGKIVFNNSFTYVLAGAGDLTMAVSAGTALIDAQAGTQKITLPLTIASSTVLEADSGATLVIGAPVTVNAGASLTQTGTGSVQYQSTITVNPGGSISLAAASHAASLSLLGASTASLIAQTGAATTALKLDALSMASGSTFNLKNGELIVQGGNLTSIQSSLKSGYASGSWVGLGINSSFAAADSTHLTAIGVIPNGATGGPNYTTFGGMSVSVGDVLLKYTYYGDTNLDGKVDGSDYSRIDSGYLTQATGWYNGDLNYDGVINGSDYTLMDNTFNTQGAVISSDVAAQSTAQLASGVGSAVPEPATLGLLMIGSVGSLLGRRRRIA